jgi:hypothetical protein
MTDTIMTNQEIAASIRNLLKMNGWKAGSKTAKDVEYAYLRGMMEANPAYVDNAFLNICLMSGRSVASYDFNRK